MHPPGARRPRTVRKALSRTAALAGHRAARGALAVGLLSGALGTTAAALAPAHGPVPTVFCGRPDSTDFPLASRVYGGPATYPAGGGWRTWRLELRNTTDAVCEDVHPVVVLAAAHHGLRPGRIRLEYRDPADGDWRAVPFEATDHEEQVGVFAKSGGTAEPGEPGGSGERGSGRAPGGGLSVPAKGTLAVPVRLRFAPETVPDRITATVTTVQRRGSDGEWIGQSVPYPFAVRAGRSGRSEESGEAGRPDASSAPLPPEKTPAAPVPPQELAATAQGPVRPLSLAAAALLAAGGLALAGARRLRR
ncbi:hypothetical protein AB0D04_20930 [Streptomyces sp. NPDC048483]|uniref:hypothetical protein n=1 Tax=Streptomyces sp. NPDC048483 TaxID=3154927 RepID=UPI0034315131